MNKTNGSGETALMLAINNELVNCVDLLLGAEADVNQVNKRGESTLSYALRDGNNECTKKLIEAGADRWGHDLICKTITKEGFKESVIKVLMRAGAHVNVDGENPVTLCKDYYRDAWFKYPEEKLLTMLFAAGQRFDKTDVPTDLRPSKQLNLMELCRESIRKHMLQMSRVNLLFRVPRLGLPAPLVDHVLYGVSPSANE